MCPWPTLVFLVDFGFLAPKLLNYLAFQCVDWSYPENVAKLDIYCLFLVTKLAKYCHKGKIEIRGKMKDRNNKIVPRALI